MSTFSNHYLHSDSMHFRVVFFIVMHLLKCLRQRQSHIQYKKHFKANENKNCNYIEVCYGIFFSLNQVFKMTRMKPQKSSLVFMQILTSPSSSILRPAYSINQSRYQGKATHTLRLMENHFLQPYTLANRTTH